MSVGKRIQMLRKKQGWSQGDIAIKIDVTRQTISKWELDETLPDTENVLKLCNLFEISTDNLLKDSINLQHNLDKTEIKTPQNKFFQYGVIFLVLGLLITGVLLTLSQVIPSRMKVIQTYTADDIVNIGDESVTEKGRTTYSYIKTTGFLPFLNTYYLHWLFLSGCSLIGLSVYCFIRHNKIKKQCPK